MISKLLSRAVKLYLRSQVTRAENLQVKIEGRNKQILTGNIPQVLLSCDRAVYQGLYLSQVKLRGADIAINLPEVLKKQPLRLIRPILVEIELLLDASDLEASLDSTLLQGGLADLWQMILATLDVPSVDDLTIVWQSIAIAEHQLHLKGIYQDTSGATRTLTLTTGISLVNSNTIGLLPLNIISDSFQSNFDRQLEIDLGTDVDFTELTIRCEQIICSGKIKISS